MRIVAVRTKGNSPRAPTLKSTSASAHSDNYRDTDFIMVAAVSNQPYL